MRCPGPSFAEVCSLNSFGLGPEPNPAGSGGSASCKLDNMNIVIRKGGFSCMQKKSNGRKTTTPPSSETGEEGPSAPTNSLQSTSPSISGNSACTKATQIWETGKLLGASFTGAEDEVIRSKEGIGGVK
ncbi:hypothetical protein Ancab_002920 [Ancistrocladus abbreviatus]